MIPADWAQRLHPHCALVGIGNPLRGDDGFGPFVISLLQNRTSLPLLDGGLAPENLTGPLRRLAPSEVILFDALRIDGPAGSLHWLEPDQLDAVGCSTHGPSIDLFASYLHQNMAIQVRLIGVVPAQTTLGMSLSDNVRRSAQQLVDFIATHWPPTQLYGD